MTKTEFYVRRCMKTRIFYKLSIYIFIYRDFLEFNCFHTLSYTKNIIKIKYNIKYLKKLQKIFTKLKNVL